MSSEDKSLEASDQGPSPPPPGSAGATPTGSPATPTGSPAATDRRPRGRPRKDAVVPPTAPVPTTRPKKKSRSRGRAAADDEDSMDGVEMAGSQSAQDMETSGQQEAEDGSEPAGAAEGPAEEDESSGPSPGGSQRHESAGCSASAATPTKSSELLCAFCYCGGRSLLGQGELKAFGPTPGYAPQHRPDRTGSAEDHGEKSPARNSSWRGPSGPRTSCSPFAPGPGEDPANRFWDELGQVGLPDDIDVHSLFDISGGCCAHQHCAEWSEGVYQGESQSLCNVDRAVDSGSTEHCAYCKRLGASIKCCEETCGRLYHYPCAAAAGAFQNVRGHTLLCPEHIQQAVDRSQQDASCVLCDSPGDLLDQLFCTSCGQHYHGMCLDIATTPVKRAGWQCPECKVCQTCKNPGEDSKMLVCDTCDKGYHTFCLQPAMDSLPTNGWRCQNCRVCVQCGSRTSGQWHHNCLLCDGCYQQQDAMPTCALCRTPLTPESQRDLLSCHVCKRWLHLECERQVKGDAELQVREDYVCTDCRLEELAEEKASVGDAGEFAEEPPEPGSEPSGDDVIEEMFLAEHVPNQMAISDIQKCFTSAMGPGREIQVTVTVMESPESPPQRVEEPDPPSLVTAYRKADVVLDAVAETVESEDMSPEPPPEEPEEEPGAESPPRPSPSPTKETAAEPLEAEGEEPMEVSPAERSGPDAAVEATAPEPQGPLTGEEEPEGEEEHEEEEEPEEEEEAKALVPVEAEPEPEEVPAAAESSPAAEMDTTPPSERSLSDLSPPAEESAPKRSPPEERPAPSPPPAWPSPKEPSPPHAPAAGEHGGSAPPTTFIPVTPKIGMGKPAISKRKFSPGRPRAKQGVWIARGNTHSPSWSLDQSEGWDSPKTRQSPTTPTWSIKVGRGSGFPGKRRPRGAGLSGRGGRGRSKPKNGISPVATPGVPVGVMETAFPGKEEEENAMHNTVVMFSSSDTFTLKQDMCVVCGSFGQGAEGRLLACAQCGQCYHPFCVNIKITRVVLSKGWRCLECTVCEECGKATDPGRLLLCDDCDISYHTYCLDPPLQTVPKGSWKCKWCVSCTQCGATSPGPRCEWQNNYTQCAPCASLATCPVCLRSYCEEELIVQCRQCDRWMHAACQNLNTEEEVESAAEDSFDCTMCRVHTPPSQVTTVAVSTEPVEQPIAVQIVTKVKELDPAKTYTQDGVCLTESGLSQLQSLAAAASRRKRPKPKLKLKIINQNSVAVLQTPPDPHSEHSRDGDLDDSREGDHLDCEGKSDSSPEREPADEDGKGAEGPDGAKKRKRKPYRPGIGGFMVRQRSRAGQGKAKRSLSRKDSSGSVSENPLGKDEGWSEALPDTPVEENVPGSECLEKAKKRYRKKKTKLEEAFPSYLQEAFFGKELLDKSRQSKQALETGLSDDDRSHGHAHTDGKPSSASFLDPSSDPLLSAAATPASTKPGAQTNSEDPLEDLSEVLNTDADILGMLSGDLGKPTDDSGLDLCPFQVENPPSPFAGLDIGPITDDSAATPQTLPTRGPRTLPEEPLDHILSPELDKMVTDGAILSKLYKIPELEGKDVEELFTAVLSPTPSQPPQLVQPPPSTAVPPPPGPAMPLSNPGNGMFPRMPMMNGMMGHGPHFAATPLSPGAGPCVSTSFSPLHRLPFPDNARDKKFSPMGRDGPGPWGTPGPAPPLEGEADTMSNAQRSTLKWEKEETLGEMATVAPVLYTNVNFPNLRDEFPDWSTRVKQIAKLWRKASSQERAPYVQKARDNRAALRINKVQLSNESIKRQQQQQQHPQQPPDTFDPVVPMETDLFKDPLKHKESEHEQEWKFRQQMRQKSKQQAKIEATQKLEQMKSEQQQLQQQQQQGSNPDGETPGSGNQSPVTPQGSNGNVSPMQQTSSKDGFARPQLPGPSTPGSTDDVFLRPPPPPPAGSRTPAQDTCLQGQSSQPQSPQVFSSPSSSGSRPSSPWDPYAKMVGTPRPPPLGSSTPRRNSESGKSPRSLPEQQERGRPSPAHESFGSPTSMSSDPYAKPPDTPRPVAAADPFLKPMGPPRPSPGSEQHGRQAMSSMAGDTFVRPALRNEVYQRMPQNKMILSDPYSRPLLTPIPGSNESGSVSVFKMPMPPPQSQDLYGSMISAPRRGSIDPYERPVLTPRPLDGVSQNQPGDPYAHPPLTPRPSMNDCFPNPPRMVRLPQGNPFTQPGSREPPRDSYAHAPSTPRPDYSQSMPDPYAQPPGTPRPSSDPYAQPPGTPRPSSDPYAQPPGTPRPLPDPYAQPPGTPRPSSDPYAQPPGTPRPSSDPYAQPPGTPRPSSDPYAQPPGTPRPSSDPYAQPPGTPRPLPDPYAQPPGTPRPLPDPYAQPPGTPRPSSDPYAQPPGTPRPLPDPYAQPPGTPRPLPDPYAQPPGTPRPSSSLYAQPPPASTRPVAVEQYLQQPPNRKPSPSHSADPYAQPPGTPRPIAGERFSKSPGSQRNSDLYAHPPGTPRPLSNDPYVQPPGTPRPVLSDPYAQPPGTPRPGAGPDGFNRAIIRPGSTSSQDPFSPPQARMQETFVRPAAPGSQTPKHSGMSDNGFSPSHLPNQTPVHDPYEQAPMTPRPPSGERLSHDMNDQGMSQEGSSQDLGHFSTLSQSTGTPSEAHNAGPADTEEKFRQVQRQRIRELILKQQQQKQNAVRQEKGLQEQGVAAGPGTPRHWSQENPSQHNELFSRPPPPYPGTMRGPLRYPGPFPGDRRASFPNEGHFVRPQYPGDIANMGMRPHGPRFAYPPGGQGPHGGQERFLNPPHQMQAPMMDLPQQMRRPPPVDLARSMGNNMTGLPQHFPPRGIPMQQHNIMGQPFIELRHRAPESRMRLPFGPQVMAGNVMDPPQRQPGLMGGPDIGFPLSQGPRMMDPAMSQPLGMGGHMQMSSSMENLHQQPMQMNTGPQHPPLMRSQSHLNPSESFTAAPTMLLPPAPAEQSEEIPIATADAIEEKLDADDSAVKDLEDVEVKDLVDADLENLNLDPDDGKDLDLETNDLHLDDFLRSGKFDIIAYTDPELDLEDKKDMFNEELDLSDPIDDHSETSDLQKALSEKRNASAGGSGSSSQVTTESRECKSADAAECLSQIKQEGGCQSAKELCTEQTIKTEGKDCFLQGQEASICRDQTNKGAALPQEVPGQQAVQPCASTLSDSTPVLSSLLVKEKTEDTQIGPVCPDQSNPTAQSSQVSGMPQNNGAMMPAVQIPEHGVNPGLSLGHMMDPTQGAPLANPNIMQGQPPCQNFGAAQPVDQMLTVGNQPNMSQAQQAMFSQAMGPQGQQNRPLLLDEQPLLLQDLLDQERQEQQQQRQMQAMIRQRSSDSFFPNIDIDAITDPIMKAKMIALKGINKVMVQNNMGMAPMVMNRFQLGPHQAPAAECPENMPVPQQAVGMDGKLLPHMARPNPPNFGPGFVNDAQKKQYEDWLKETQQLLQMQQKFLEEQIGAHRKSKKALSAKQRTAKKAGREFPEEDAEQLKHVTEQQGMVQKQLEQIRKQQKEHAELIEEYRVKQQQCAMQQAGMPGAPAQPGIMPGGAPMNPPVMNPMMQMQPHPGQPNPTRMPNAPGWHPGAPLPMGGPRMPGIVPPQTAPPTNPAQAPQQPPALGGGAPAQPPGDSPHVKFDDNNPFSEGFQERERKERLREQQERQRVQLMQEVERQRALQQRLELEQQGMMGADASANRAPLSQMAFYNSELPQDFMQPQRPMLPQQQQQMGQMFPQQQGFMGPHAGAPYMQGGERRPMVGNGVFGPEMGPNYQPGNTALQGPNFVPGQPRPPRFMGPGMMMQGAGDGHPFGMEPSTPLPPNYPGSGQSLIQLYSNIIPEEKGKKKRNRKKKKDEDADSVKTPSTPHSDLTAPLTPCVSDTSSTPTRSAPHLGESDPSERLPGCSTPGSLGSLPPSELERQLSGGSGGGPGRPCGPGSLTDRILSNIKLERVEASECHGPRDHKLETAAGAVKVEEGKDGASPRPAGHSPAHAAKGESGNELLKHLLKHKSTPPPFPHQRSDEGLRSEDEESPESKALPKHGSTDPAGAASDVSGHPQPEQDKKKPRNKRAPKNGEKPASRYKKRKKEEEERQAVYSSTDTLMTQLKQQLSLLPLMEPLIGVNFAHFPPYGSGQLNGESRLSGTFGSASLDGVSDYYSQLIYKQNNLSNPPTPPASLPPTPPPVARQKMVNGFATSEELASKAAIMGGHDVTKGLAPKQIQAAFRPEEDLLARAIAQGPKTVDVPASLPTPPHNNQEELRGQEHCDDRDTPDSFVPSSSPESVVGMEISRYPDLSLVKAEPPSPAPSPVIPMLPSSTGKGSEVRQRDVKMEPPNTFFGSQFGHAPNGSKTGLVSIAITLNPAAAENISGVMAAMADLLCMKAPCNYEVTNAPDRGPPAPMFRGPGAGPQGMVRFMRPPGPPGALHFPPVGTGPAMVRGDHPTGPRPQWCCHCKVVVLGNGVRKPVKDLNCNKKDSSQVQGRSEGDMVFCSHNCLVLHSSATQSKTPDTKEAVALLPSSTFKESPSKALHQYSNNMSALDVHSLSQLQPKQSPPSTPPIAFPSAAFEATKAEAKPDALKVTVKLKPRPRAVHNADEGRPHGKKWKGLRWRKWSVQIVVPKGDFRLPGEDEIDELLKKLGASLRPEPLPRDRRKCCFCHEEGDGVTDGPARLLNLDLDLWVHLNCALWSTEVYETQAGALINVELALRRGLTVRCTYCQRTGATSGCHRLRCANVYHFTCALRAQCTFFKDKTMLCHQHRPRGGAQGQELRYFAVFRRVYVQRDEVRQLASVVRRPERDHTFRVGSLIFHAVGQLLPQQMAAFHGPAAIFPAGYEASRIYWSMRHGNRRCRYLCSIDERDDLPEFSIRVLEQGYEELLLTDSTPKGVWDKVLGPVAERRTESGTLKLFPVYLKGEDLFGLTVSAVTRITESLPGVEACENYTFRYGRNPLMELPLVFNPTGSARSQPNTSSQAKRFVLRPRTLTSSGTSRPLQNASSGELGTPYSKQFVHSKSSQYRRLKSEWKSNVYLACSPIQGLGLYAAKDLEKYTMVIEYVGTVIRNEVANRKEKLYESQNRNAYMFRLDSEHVIDATLTGGPARYINHSCAPNCVAEAVTFERGHRIIITSIRKIQKGEELCYDYKFDLEDDQHKIPCHCGAVNCRKWMN
ncbi:histone-lysine N-methyltransferase 2C-like isoform X6 [Anguilla rostrata]|uniref:histone-lysine N-methyltransferase 2C-like isoform X6 n=1 Tax=Anguilla rostrata TaxID=7938 RepID=UPI0030D48317